MGSRYSQVIAIKQKIERLQAQLEYLEKLDKLEDRQNSALQSADEKEQEGKN